MMNAFTELETATGAEAPIALIDLKAQQARIRHNLDRAIQRVLDHGQYIMGPEVAELERRLAAFCGAKHAITCSSGTDALLISLMAMGIGPGDAVICPAFTYTATPEVIALLGATPVFCDVDRRSFNIDTSALPAAIETAAEKGLRPRAIMPVDLFGQPADYDALLPIAEEHGMLVLSDAAQSFGAETRGRKVGQIGHVVATSFFPAKPLGCYGDGGAIFTADDTLADVVRSIRLHGRGGDKYDIVRVGINGRIDTLQAAILIEKLEIFRDEIARRQQIARRYQAGLDNVVVVPRIPADVLSVWAQFTVVVPNGRRDELAAALQKRGIPTAVYYPRPLHEQTAFSVYPVSKAGVPVAERLAMEVLSLPMHPYLAAHQQDRIIDAIVSAVNGRPA
jgi:dTDP-4-amino-4,6-dideoxygalactose transaminase